MKRTSLHKIAACFIASLCVMSLMPATATAWGARGHRIVALIAQHRLSPNAQTEIRRILGNTNLANIANFADAFRETHPETSNWHFVDIPLTVNTFNPARVCRPTPKGDCSIAEIDRATATLRDSTATPEDRKLALEFIVHIIGDLHQPLHNATKITRSGGRTTDDIGGNLTAISFFGQTGALRRFNLHAAWDHFIIDHMNLSESAHVAKLETALQSENISEIEQGTTIDWALAAHKVAQDNAYGLLPRRRQGRFDLDEEYFQANAPEVDKQLMKGGVRLAKVLNDIFQ